MKLCLFFQEKARFLTISEYAICGNKFTTKFGTKIAPRF